jgi:hypothetical protein
LASSTSVGSFLRSTLIVILQNWPMGAPFVVFLAVLLFALQCKRVPELT